VCLREFVTKPILIYLESWIATTNNTSLKLRSNFLIEFNHKNILPSGITETICYTEKSKRPLIQTVIESLDKFIKQNGNCKSVLSWNTVGWWLYFLLSMYIIRMIIFVCIYANELVLWFFKNTTTCLPATRKDFYLPFWQLHNFSISFYFKNWVCLTSLSFYMIKRAVQMFI
jgi:hypothetical protein